MNSLLPITLLVIFQRKRNIEWIFLSSIFIYLKKLFSSTALGKRGSLRDKGRISTGSLQYQMKHHTSSTESELADLAPQTFSKAVLYVLGEKTQVKVSIYELVTACQRSCGWCCFQSSLSINQSFCPAGGVHVTVTHDVLDLSVQSHPSPGPLAHPPPPPLGGTSLYKLPLRPVYTYHLCLRVRLRHCQSLSLCQ